MSDTIVSEGVDEAYDSISEIGQASTEQPSRTRSKSLLLPTVFIGNEEQSDCSNDNHRDGVQT